MTLPSIHHNFIVDKTQSRAFINDTDIVDPKTGKLGFRIYKNDTFADKFVLFFKKIFLRTVTFKEGNGEVLIASKSSLKEWAKVHGVANFPSGNERFAVIDRIFNDTDKATKQKNEDKTQKKLETPKEEKPKVKGEEKPKIKGEEKPRVEDKNKDKTKGTEKAKDMQDLKKTRVKTEQEEFVEDVVNRIVNRKRLGNEHQAKNIAEFEDLKNRIEENAFSISTPFSEVSERVHLGVLDRLDNLKKQLDAFINRAEERSVDQYNADNMEKIFEEFHEKLNKLKPEQEKELNAEIDALREKTNEDLDKDTCVETLKKESPQLYNGVKLLKDRIDLIKLKYEFVKNMEKTFQVSSLEDLFNKIKNKDENREPEFIELRDAVERMGEHQNEDIENFLVELSQDDDGPLSKDAGELIARMWIKRDEFNFLNYNKLGKKAKSAAYEEINTHKKTWITVHELQGTV